MIKQTKDMKALEVFNNVCEETINNFRARRNKKI